jgi:hypothetical protein
MKPNLDLFVFINKLSNKSILFQNAIEIKPGNDKY